MAKFYSQLTSQLQTFIQNQNIFFTIILLNIESIQTSCGSGVPIYEFKEDRETLIVWAAKKGESGIKKYRKQNNQQSIDGLPTKLNA